MIQKAIAALVAITAACSPGVPGQQSDGGQAAESDLRMSRVRLATGVVLHVAERGASDGEPVLFLHGFPDSWFSYSSAMQLLPSDVRAIVPTQRGHGDSDHPACCYAITDLAADAVALLDALGITRATVVGHSMGSFVAQRMAIDHPNRVSRLVLIGSATTPRSTPVLEFNAVVQKLTEPIDPEFVREFQVSTTAIAVSEEFMEGIIKESEKLPARVWRDVMAALASPDVKYEAERIRARTLIIWGAKDALFDRAEQEALLQRIPDVRFIRYDELGHSPQWERPDRFTADLLDFLGMSAARAEVAPAS